MPNETIETSKTQYWIAIIVGVLFAAAIGGACGWGLKWAYVAWKWPAQSKILGGIFALVLVPFAFIRYYVYILKMNGTLGPVCPSCGEINNGKFCGHCGAGA